MHVNIKISLKVDQTITGSYMFNESLATILWT